MPGGYTKFNAAWLSHVDANNQTIGKWCRKGKDDYHAYCHFCDSEIKCDNSGKQQVLQHAKQAKHRESIKHLQDNQQSKLVFASAVPSTSSSAQQGAASASGNLVTINYSDASHVAEIYWLAKVANCNYSLRSVDGIGDTFRKMFPDSKIAAGFSLSRTSASYMMSEGLAPPFRKMIIEDVLKSNLPFSMHFDETSTAQVKKQMDLTLRYWSPTHNEVWVTFYTALFFGHAEGEKVASKMFDQMAEDGLPMDRLITLVRDGPNVNKTIMRKLQQLITDKHPQFGGFIDLGSCVLHIVHNAFGKGLEKYGKDIDQLCLDLHSLFKYSAARRQDYKELQLDLDVEMHTFQQHTEVRWLSIGPAIRRILEQWDAICEFINIMGKDEKKAPKSINFKRAASMLTGVEKDVTKTTLEFLNSVIPLFESFLTLFQRSGPTIHMVYDSMCQTLLKVMRRYLRTSVLEGKYGSELATIPSASGDISAQVKDKDIVMGDKTKEALGLLKPDKQKVAIIGMRSFYGATVSHLQTRLPLNNTLLQDLGCLNPSNRARKTTTVAIQNLARKLQPQLDVPTVLDEWKVYQIDEDVSALDATQRVAQYWNAVFQLKSFDGNSRYLHLAKLVKAGLVLAQTNGESERSLSINGRVVTKDRALLGETTVVGIRAVKEAVRFHDPVHHKPENIALTKEVKLSVRRANASYQTRLEEEKIQEEKKREEARKKRVEAERVQKDKDQMSEAKKSLAKSEEELTRKEAEVRADVDAADELLNDATSKLHDALSGSSVNKQSISVASMMLDTAKTKREQAMQRLDKVREKRKSLDSKRHKLLEKAIPSTKTTKKKSQTKDDETPAAKKSKKE